MSTVNISALSDSFSWQRVAAVARFYFPHLKKQMIWYLCISLVFAVLTGIIANSWAAVFIWSLITGIIGYMVNFNPLIFCYYSKGLEIETSLPANGLEKSVFILLYSLVVIPIIACLPVTIVYLVNLSAFASNEELAYISQLTIDSFRGSYGLIIFQYTTFILTCLWAVVASRRGRMTKGIIVPIVVKVVLSVITGIYLAVTALHSTMLTTVSNSNTNSQELALSLVNSMSAVTIPLGIVELLYSIFAIVMITRAISNRQI